MALSNESSLQGYFFYDSCNAVSPLELQELYAFTTWGKSRSVEQIGKMLRHTDLCVSVRYNGRLVAFCRLLTDYVFRASLWDIMVHPDHQGKGLGTAVIEYALGHPAIKDVPLVITYSTELRPFLERVGFSSKEGTFLLQRRPLAYS